MKKKIKIETTRRYVAYSDMRNGWCIYQDNENGVTADMLHGPFLNEKDARYAYRTFFPND